MHLLYGISTQSRNSYQVQQEPPQAHAFLKMPWLSKLLYPVQIFSTFVSGTRIVDKLGGINSPSSSVWRYLKSFVTSLKTGFKSSWYYKGQVFYPLYYCWEENKKFGPPSF